MITYPTVPGFVENWFPAQSCDTLARLVGAVKEIDGMLVELGSWEGRSTIAMANAAHPRIVQAVDTWEGSPGEISSELAAKRDVFAKWSANVAHYTQGNVKANRMGWRQFFNDLRNNGPYDTPPIALLFIDAEHTYTEVHDTILAFEPYMANGGIICGDDAHHPPIRQALDETFGIGTLHFEATLWIHRVPK